MLVKQTQRLNKYIHSLVKKLHFVNEMQLYQVYSVDFWITEVRSSQVHYQKIV